MPWYEKDHPTFLEDQPINGLAFLHGDAIARQFAQEWARGKKYPLITFPSGTSREVIPDKDTANISLFGTITLPRSGGYEASFEQLLEDGQELGLKLTGDNNQTLVVLNPVSRRGYRLSFDPTTDELVDLLSLPQGAMELLPGDLRAVLPKLYSQDGKSLNAIAPLKFFTPDANWTWYPTEFDGDDLFFGLVSGNVVELGYFTLSDLERLRGPFGLSIERDLHFTPKSLKTLQDNHESR